MNMTTRPGVNAAGGFTLIEMTLAVAILAIISVTVYQFTDVAIRATDQSMQVSAEDMACGGLRKLLSAQLAALPSNQNGTLIGVKNAGRGGARHDSLQMVCPAGNAVLTPDAKGYYQIGLDLREIPRGSGQWALGMERTPWTDDDDDDDDDDNAVKPKTSAPGALRPVLPSDWVKLMDRVNGLEIMYFDARLNDWQDKWTDQANLPNLVRIRVSLVGNSQPYEIVERVPGGGLAKVIPTSVFPGGFNPATGQNVNNRNLP